MESKNEAKGANKERVVRVKKGQLVGVSPLASPIPA